MTDGKSPRLERKRKLHVPVFMLHEYDTRSRLPYASKVLPNRPFQARPRLGDWLGRPHAMFAIVWTTGDRTADGRGACTES